MTVSLGSKRCLQSDWIFRNCQFCRFCRLTGSWRGTITDVPDATGRRWRRTERRRWQGPGCRKGYAGRGDGGDCFPPSSDVSSTTKKFSTSPLSGNSNNSWGGGGGGSNRGSGGGGNKQNKPKEITVHSPGPTLGSRLLRTGGEGRGESGEDLSPFHDSVRCDLRFRHLTLERGGARTGPDPGTTQHGLRQNLGPILGDRIRRR